MKDSILSRTKLSISAFVAEVFLTTLSNYFFNSAISVLQASLSIFWPKSCIMLSKLKGTKTLLLFSFTLLRMRRMMSRKRRREEGDVLISLKFLRVKAWLLNISLIISASISTPFSLNNSYNSLESSAPEPSVSNLRKRRSIFSF